MIALDPVQVGEALQRMQDQQVELANQIMAVRAENEALRAERTASWAYLPDIVSALRSQSEALRAAGARVQLVDTRGIGKPNARTAVLSTSASMAVRLSCMLCT